MTKIKICGITRPDDAHYAAELGADFLGFIFVPGSPRYIDPKRAARIIAQVQWSGGKGNRHDGRPIESQPLHCVGVFRDASLEEIRRVCQIAGNDHVQLTGNEPDDLVRELGKPVLRAVPVGDTVPIVATSADWLLFDTHDAQKGGGTGRTFDWNLLARVSRSKPFFLAGGLTPDNVEDAIRAVRPDGVDVASGVESQPGVKDHNKLRKFFDRVKST